ARLGCASAGDADCRPFHIYVQNRRTAIHGGRFPDAALVCRWVSAQCLARSERGFPRAGARTASLTTTRPRSHRLVKTGDTSALMPDKKKVVVVMPAYNAAKTLKMTYADLPHDVVDLVILVDDGSSDETVAIARELGLELFIHNRNYGYGANQKT